jgi:hypothetical protein
MKRAYAIAGVVLLIIAAFFTFYGSYLNQVLGLAGFTTQSTVFDKEYSVSMNSSGYSSVTFHLSPQDAMSASIQSSPRGLDILLMNAGNFSLFNQSNGQNRAVQVYYPQSVLNVTSSPYNLSFNDSSTSGNYTLVFKNPRSGTTDVLARITIVNNAVSPEVSYIPYAIAIIGILLIAVGAFSGNPKRRPVSMAAGPQRPIAGQGAQRPPHALGPQSLASPPPPPPTTPPRCKYCGATISGGQAFCPSCHRSQV